MEGGNKKLVSLTLKRQVSVYNNIHLVFKLVLTKISSSVEEGDAASLIFTRFNIKTETRWRYF